MTKKIEVTPQDIKSIRATFNWSQVKMAKKLMVSKAAIARWELGKTPSGPALILLSLLIPIVS